MNLKPGGSFLQVTVLVVVFQMLQMGYNSIRTLLYHFTDNSDLVIWLSLTLFDSDGAFRAVSDTRPEPVTHQLRYQPYLAVNHLKSTFVAVGYTNAASVAFLLIYLNNVSLHFIVSVL